MLHRSIGAACLLQRLSPNTAAGSGRGAAMLQHAPHAMRPFCLPACQRDGRPVLARARLTCTLHLPPLPGLVLQVRERPIMIAEVEELPEDAADSDEV